jgi:hypothetical protein
LALAAIPAIAGDAPPLRLPVDCDPGRSCWIANLVDRDPGAGALDYACGHMTYDGHNGTDFAVRDLRAMAEGVRVLAAAAGKVAAIRDGEPDISVIERGRAAVEGKECGNGVRIDHDNGWQTQYCHLRLGSITVKPGSVVAPGDPIGLVGMSGLSELPHVHFVVRHAGRIVDPFHSAPGRENCGAETSPLWDEATRAALPYARGSLYNYGVAPEAARPEDARAGKFRATDLPRDAPVFAVWAEAFAVDTGDMLEIRVTAPDGATFMARRMPVEKRQARIYRMIGRKRGPASWSPGEYHVKITLARAGGPAQGATDASFIARVH